MLIGCLNHMILHVCVYSVFLVLFVGNVDIWHGNIVILVKHTAITIGRRAEVPEPDDESDDEEIYPQPAHKTFKPDDSGQNYYTVEVKKQDSDLYRYDVYMQIISQTLTNAFAQRKLCNLSLVPSIGCTADEFIIYFYHSERDVLLRRVHKHNLFCNEDMIFESVVELWFLNFYVFYPTLSKEVISKLPRSGFRNSLEDTRVLDKYKKGLDVGVDMQGVCPTLDETTLIHANFIQSPKIV